MKFRWILIIFILSAVLVIAGCGDNTTVCGDGTCDTTESCQCKDCEKDVKCTVKTIGNCDDSNDCTEDIFNEKTNQCERKNKANCCGNGNCEENERCNEATHQTNCAKDCTYVCGAYVNVESFKCSDSKCQETSENRFILTGSSAIKTNLQNIGEAGSTISSFFKCMRGANYISRDGDSLFGIKFTNFYNNGVEDLSLSGRQSETGGDKGTYILRFDYTKAEVSDLQCEISLQDIPALNNIQTVYIAFK